MVSIARLVMCLIFLWWQLRSSHVPFHLRWSFLASWHTAQTSICDSTYFDHINVTAPRHCTECRRLKRRCLKDEPACTYCVNKGLQCVYAPPKKRARRAIAPAILAHVNLDTYRLVVLRLTEFELNHTQSTLANNSAESQPAQPSKTSLVIGFAPWAVEDDTGVTHDQLVEKYENLQEEQYYLKPKYGAFEKKCGELGLLCSNQEAQLNVQEMRIERLEGQLKTQRNIANKALALKKLNGVQVMKTENVDSISS